MSKLVAVNGCTLAFTTNQNNSSITITGTASTKVKVNGNGIWVKKIDFSITGYVLGSFTQTGSVTGSVTASAEKVTSQGDAVVLLGDKSATLTINGMIGETSATVQDVVYVKDAGQNVVKAT